MGHFMPTLYAMYLQATRLHPNTGKVQRKQWIVLPPLPEEVANKFSLKGRDEFLMFHREQQSPENRVKWRYTFDSDGVLGRTLPNEVANLMVANRSWAEEEQWKISPVITAQVTPRELSDLQQTPQTPYAVLRRFEKVAAKKYGLSI